MSESPVNRESLRMRTTRVVNFVDPPPISWTGPLMLLIFAALPIWVRATWVEGLDGAWRLWGAGVTAFFIAVYLAEAIVDAGQLLARDARRLVRR